MIYSLKHTYIFAISLLIILTAACEEQSTEEEDKVKEPSVSDISWYKKAIIYNLDVETFQDANGDGVGDFQGLISRLDYLDSLGITAIWLAPFQPTPNKDDGYDISDYYKIDKRLGNFTDFNQFVAACHKRGMRIIMDLVVNHTSDEHPWFQQAKNQYSPYRSWYVWSKELPDNHDQGMVFPGVQKAIWSYDTQSKAYYYHRFYKWQPDLNMQNPAVITEIKKIVSFWMEKGIGAYRLDGVPFFIEVPQKDGEKFPHQFGLLDTLRQVMASVDSEAVLIGEANVAPKESMDFFGGETQRLQVILNFYVNQYLFYALATGDCRGMQEALKVTKDIPAAAQWGQFLRNHDEIDLGRLSGKERDRVYEAFGPDSSMQLYDRGIRRRLAPMLKYERRIKMAYSLLLSLPSTPVIRYGEEIGMGDALSLKERLAIRTPMQWANAKNAEFSTSSNIVRPVIDTGAYRYEKVNVADETKDPHSLLNTVRKLISIRKTYHEMLSGSWEILDAGNPTVLAIVYHYRERDLVTIHNFSPSWETINLPVPGDSACLVRSSSNPFINRTTGNRATGYQMEGWGYCWYFSKGTKYSK